MRFLKNPILQNAKIRFLQMGLNMIKIIIFYVFFEFTMFAVLQLGP
jgi:hypothetical protein